MPSVLSAVIPRGQHDAMGIECLIDVGLHVMAVHIATHTAARVQTPWTLIGPEDEVVGPSVLVTVVATVEHGSLGAAGYADTYLFGGHELVLFVESLNGVECGPLLDITRHPVLE